MVKNITRSLSLSFLARMATTAVSLKICQHSEFSMQRMLKLRHPCPLFFLQLFLGSVDNSATPTCRGLTTARWQQ
ncbi:hypothetical protein [Legionella worsleiensis]|uniref:Uncharacterized protein n=1 Tax=Legionella worsleiensis TaxID=45076 RepID=A0A0W1A6E4_9GAMM|nr:hypothetical protein [Legionella worsleiensis]KTD76857.1 hypothetical protein Lwor_2082 [Legionella worsleiensis]STY33474.1 Uncharacterised protein [Legionella worsleiensis]